MRPSVGGVFPRCWHQRLDWKDDEEDRLDPRSARVGRREDANELGRACSTGPRQEDDVTDEDRDDGRDVNGYSRAT